MTKFSETPEGEAFVASANDRETSREIMEAIAFHARNTDEAERLWNGDGFGVICQPTDLWETVTRNGQRDTSEFCWGVEGSNWWEALSRDAE